MAVYRKIPTCNFCGNEIAKMIVNNKSEIYGDNFIRWEFLDHKCSEMQNFIKSNLDVKNTIYEKKDNEIKKNSE